MEKKCIIGLGSNFDKEENMKKAISMLAGTFPDIRFGEFMETEPEGMGNDWKFFNGIAVMHTDMDEYELKSVFKQIEKKIGRTAEEKHEGIVRIDIDLLTCGENILKQKDLEKEYMKQLVQTI